MKIVTKKFLSLALAGVMFTSTGAAVTARADETLTDTSFVQSKDEEKIWGINHPCPWKRPPHPEDACMPGDAWNKKPEQPKVKKFPNR